MKTIQKILLIILLCQIGFSQGTEDSISKLNAHLKAFDYPKVISLSKEIISKPDKLSIKMKTEVLRMQAVAYYSIDELLQAEKSFTNLLQIQAGFILSPSENSPKIITFFNDTKLKYLSHKLKQPKTDNVDTLAIANLKQNLHDYKAGMLRSIILPGWGHYYVNEPLKGKLLNIGSVLTLVPAIYYSIETEQLEKKYLNESDRGKIESRYNSFNTSYKYRNFLLYSFAAVWLYSQYDYFFSERPSYTQNFTIFPGYDSFNKTKVIHLSINL